MRWWVALLVGGLLGGLLSCFDAPRPPSPPPAPPDAPPAAPAPPDAPADTAPLSDRLAYWERRAIVLEGSYQSAKRAARSLREEVALAPFRALMVWATWIGGAVALLGFLAAVLAVPLGLPFGWKAAALVGGLGLALAAGAQGLYALAPWLPGIGIGALVLLVLGLLVWAARSWHRAGQAVAREWRTYADALHPSARAPLDEDSRDRQGPAAPLVDALLSADKPAEGAPAA